MNKIKFLLLMLLISCSCSAEIINDEVADRLPRQVEQTKKYTNYNFESTIKLPIKIRIVERIKSENDILEGDILKFKVYKDVNYDSKIIIPKDRLVEARVKTIITPGMNGIPASIILDDFKVEGVSKGQFASNIEVFGQDRSLIVFPLKWALTILPPSGSLTNFIMGGHAKIKEKKTLTLYYYPEWI